jgi:hypothetical protein
LAIQERKVLDILALNPTIIAIEQAVVWTAGDGDLLVKSDHPLSATAAGVLDIPVSDDQEEQAPVRWVHVSSVSFATG